MNSEIVIVSAARTAIGAFQGDLSGVTAPNLGAAVIEAVIARAGTDKDQIDEVIMGNVLSAGVGQAPTRQAALNAGLSQATSTTTISKVCGSGMKSVMLAFDQIKAGSIELAIAGGMENMSLAPYFLPRVRSGLRLGHGEIVDHLFYDGLQNAQDGQLMGCFADANSIADNITRDHMDAYAVESLKRAQLAASKGYFDNEIWPVCSQTRYGDTIVDADESPRKAAIDKIPTLRPAFGKAGLVTAANASSISDGAAALMMMSAEKARLMNLRPLAIIKAHTSHACEPARFTHAPIDAIKKLLKKINWTVAEVDLFEVNEAFAMVAIAAINALKLPREKVNIYGGATALGHPIGASGARIIVTLLYALQRVGKTKGVASICIGGGEATAIAIELT